MNLKTNTSYLMLATFSTTSHFYSKVWLAPNVLDAPHTRDGRKACLSRVRKPNLVKHAKYKKMDMWRVYLVSNVQRHWMQAKPNLKQ